MLAGLFRLWVWRGTRSKITVGVTPDAITVGLVVARKKDFVHAYAVRTPGSVQRRVGIELANTSRIEMYVDEPDVVRMEEMLGLDLRRAAIPMQLHTNGIVSYLTTQRKTSIIPFLVVMAIPVVLALRSLGIPPGGRRTAFECAILIFLVVLRESYELPWRVDVLAAHDGLNLRKWPFLGAFVPYAEVGRVKTSDREVVLGGKNPRTLWAGSADVDRVAETIEHLRTNAATDVSLPTLRPDERDGRAWLVHLRRLAAGIDTGFREARITNDALWRVVELGTSREERIAAVVALAASSAEARPKLRVIAEHSADRDLAKKIESACDAANDAELEALLESELRENQRGG